MDRSRGDPLGGEGSCWGKRRSLSLGSVVKRSWLPEGYVSARFTQEVTTAAVWALWVPWTLLDRPVGLETADQTGRILDSAA